MRLRWIALCVSVGCGPGSGSAGSEADTGGDDGPSCEMYTGDDEIGPSVAISVRHEGTAPVFFVPFGCGGALAFDVATATGESVMHLLGECSPNTCEGFVSSSDCSGGCNDCAPPTAGRIEPSAVAMGSWSGTRLLELTLDPACAPAATGCPTTCVRPDQAEAGTYAIALTVYRTCAGTCECDPPSTSTCSLFNGDEVLSDPATVTAMVDYPSQTNVELVITD